MTENQRIIQTVRIAPWVAVVGVIGAVVLAFWVPLHPVYLCVAAALGAVSFGLWSINLRREFNFGFLGTFLTIITLLPIQKEIEPHNNLIIFQALGVWAFFFAALQLIFRKWLTGSLPNS